jgi:hypothetical protein
MCDDNNSISTSLVRKEKIDDNSRSPFIDIILVRSFDVLRIIPGDLFLVIQDSNEGNYPQKYN